MDILCKCSGYKFITKLDTNMQYYTFELDEYSIYVADICIDDVGVFSLTWDHHIKLLGDILRHLHENCITINQLKCEWAVKELTAWVIGLLHGV
ncbi:hypothetical protein ACHAW6_009697 [Cyclotella cf. meneghiniana]